MSHALHIVPEIPIESAEPGPERKLTREERDERNALLRRRAATDDEAFDALVLENIALVEYLLTRATRRRPTPYRRELIEEARSEMVLEFVAFCREWDPEQGSIAKTFPRHALRAFWRAVYRDRAVPLPEWMAPFRDERVMRYKRQALRPDVAIAATDSIDDDERQTVAPWMVAGPDASPLEQCIADESLQLRSYVEHFDADLLRTAMQRAGLNRTELGFRAGLHPDCVSKIVCGRQRPSVAASVRLLAALWPHVRSELEQRSGASWHLDANPFVELARTLPIENKERSVVTDKRVIDARRDLPRRLRAARAKSGKGLVSLARQFGVTKSTWHNWEAGGRDPSRTLSLALSTWADGVLKG